jgi:acyl carrier protein
MELKKTFAKVLGIKESDISGGISRKNTIEWDSINHLLLVSEIEKEFRINLTIKEVEEIRNYKELDLIVKKHSQKNK